MKFFDTFVNTVTDGPGVSSLATIAVDWHAGGWAGLAFNGSGAALCFGTRLLAERGRVFNPKTPMLVQAIYTACAGLVTYRYTGFSPETLILSCAVTGNLFSALQEKIIRTNLKKFLRKTVRLGDTPPSKMPPSRARSVVQTSAAIATEPNIYWTAALCKAAESFLAAPLYVLGGGISFAQPIFHDRARRFLAMAEDKRKDMMQKFAEAKTNTCGRAAKRTWFALKNRSAKVMMKKDIGLKAFAWASALAVGHNLFFYNNPRIAMATACYGLTALSIYAYNTHGGVAQAMRQNRWRPKDYVVAAR